MYKILFVHHGEGVGGAPKSLLYTIENLDNKLFQSKVLFVKKNPEIIKLFHEKGIETKVLNKHTNLLGHHLKGYVPWIRIYRLFFIFKDWYFSSKKFIPSLLENENPDILHLNSDVLTNWAYGARNHKCKVICHIRDPLRKNNILDLRYMFIRAILKKYSHKIIAISKDNAKRLNLPLKTSVVYNFVNLDEYNYKLNVNPLQKRVLYMGGSKYVKGFNQIVQALKYLADDIEVWFAGEYRKNNTFLHKLKRQNRIIGRCMQTMEKSKNAKIIGLQMKIPDIIAQCAIVVSPFNVVHFSRPLIEGFAMKKPGIATNIPGMDEIIENDVHGYLFEKNNYKEFAEHINFLLSDLNRTKYERMAQEALESAKTKFSSENVKQIEVIYHQLLQM